MKKPSREVANLRSRLANQQSQQRGGIVKLAAAGVAVSLLCTAFSTSPTSVHRWTQLQAAGAPLANGCSPGRPSKLTKSQQRKLRK